MEGIAQKIAGTVSLLFLSESHSLYLKALGWNPKSP